MNSAIVTRVSSLTQKRLHFIMVEIVNTGSSTLPSEGYVILATFLSPICIKNENCRSYLSLNAEKDSFLMQLVRMVRRYLRFRMILGVIDACVTKYSGTLVSYFIATAPVFDPRRANR